MQHTEMPRILKNPVVLGMFCEWQQMLNQTDMQSYDAYSIHFIA